MAAILQRISGAASRRPALAVTLVAVLAIAGGILALGLKPSAGTDTLVSRSSLSYRATADDARHFGDDAVIILVREKLTDLLQTGDLATITRLEACLGGQYVRANTTLRAFTAVAHAPYGGWQSPCGQLMRSRAAQVVYGPGTFLNQAVAAVNRGIDSLLAGARTASDGAARRAYTLALGQGMSRSRATAEADAAGRLEYQRELARMERLAASSGIIGTPSINDPQFIGQIALDRPQGSDRPKARFAYLFPTAGSALIQVRLRSSLSDAEQARAIGWIREAIRMPMFASAHGGRDTVTGAPVVANDLAGEISGAIAGLLAAALLVMAGTLLVAFRSPLRLLPLLIALAAAGITFGVLALARATLTMASIAVLPILIGLAVDYSVQFQARVQEARAALAAEGGPPPGAAAAIAAATGRAVPTIATAALATAVGFLVLVLSPVPMVRGFGLLLVAGVLVAFVCALIVVPAALVMRERGLGGGMIAASLRGAADVLRPLRRAIAPALRGAREILGDLGRTLTPRRAARRAGRVAAAVPGRVVMAATRRPGRLLALAGALAIAGWIAGTHTAVQSDVTKLVPARMAALRNLDSLERDTGVSGEIDVTVRAADVARPATLRWMIGYENELLARYGYREAGGCARATLCPALSLPDLFSTGGVAQPASASLTQSRIDTLLRSVPSYFSQAVLTADRREATLAFGIRLMPLARQEQVIDTMRARLHPPPGVSAALTGLPVLAAQANRALSSPGRRLLSLAAALAAVALVLLLVLRRPRRAILPMIPIVLATGWSALILDLVGIPLNPMSATLGTLVIAISTEFSVLLSERFRQERSGGHALRAALARTYRSTGAAVLVSGITAIAGFGVLVFSDIAMLRDFGLVTLIDLTVSLTGVLIVLPAVLALAEHRLPEGARTPWRASGDARGRRRRGPRPA